MNKKLVKLQEEQSNIAIIGAFTVHLRGGRGKKKRVFTHFGLKHCVHVSRILTSEPR